LCLPCLLFAKGDQVDATREVWERLHQDGHDGPKDETWMPYSVPTRIQDAVIMGPCDLVPGLLVPVCWTHLAALRRPDRPDHLPGYASLPDGLKRGRE